jgi:proteasome accessory factor A
MECELSVDTMHNLPILNTRDEPHAERSRYRRLHLIVGDANMCEYATALKVGTTRLVLDLIARDASPSLALTDPVAAIRTISHDPDLKAFVPRKTGGMISGLEIQTAYYLASLRAFSGLDEDTDWILREWRDTLTWLEKDRSGLVGRVDWVTKLWVLETFMQEEHITWENPWLASLDLEYHNVNPERGLFLGLEAEGKTRRLVTDADIDAAVAAGPSDTRGGIRGLCIRRFRDQITSMQWERIRFKGWLMPDTLDMGDLFEPETIEELHRTLERAASPADALKTWRDRKERTT